MRKACSALLLSFVLSPLAGADDPVHLETIPVSYEHAKVYVGGEQHPPTVPIALGAGPHLFIDDYLIESADGLYRMVEKPERDPKIPNPVVTGPEDKNFQPFMTALRDEERGRFRIWYDHQTEKPHYDRSLLGYMESADGIHWERPARTLPIPGEIRFGISVVDDGPDSMNPEQRYKAAWYMEWGTRLASSADGLSWQEAAPGLVFLHNHDINGMYWDPIRERYVAIVSVYPESPYWEGKRRTTMQSHSKDFKHWSPAHHIVVPDPTREEGEVQFYAIDGFLARGDLMLGFVKVLRDDLFADTPPVPEDAYGTGYTALAWSRDGDTWTRDTTPFFERNPEPGTWDHSHAWIDEQVPVGDEVYLYYAGYAHGHKVNRFEERQIGLVKMKRDRYVGWGPAKHGTLRTRPLLLESTNLRVNANAHDDHVRVRVLDIDGDPLPGYDYDDSSPVRGDHLEAPVTWEKPLAALKGQPVRFEFEIKMASLYGFYL